MKCPVCLVNMENRDERHAVDGPPGSYRMNLHCYNNECLTRTDRDNLDYGAYFQVIVSPGVEWKCKSYGLPIRRADKWFILKGEGSYTTLDVPFRFHDSLYDYSFILHLQRTAKPFVSLRTDDDMHLDALKVFNKLRNLIVIS